MINKQSIKQLAIYRFLADTRYRIKHPLQDNTIDIMGAMPNNKTKKYWGDWHYAKAMSKELKKLGYKVRILCRDNWYDRSDARYIIMLRGKYPLDFSRLRRGQKAIMWNISHPADVSISEYNQYSYVFFASNKMYDMYKDRIKPPCSVLLQCTDPDVMNNYTECDKPRYELLFIGNGKEEYRPIMRDLLPTTHSLSVYGRGWKKFPVQDYVVESYMDNNAIADAYHNSAIVLSDHWGDMCEYGIVANRLFDVLAAGGFIISDHLDEIDELFDGSVVTYTDKDDLAAKIDYYLAHPDIRKSMATKGQQIVLSNHTFANRMSELISVIKSGI